MVVVKTHASESSQRHSSRVNARPPSLFAQSGHSLIHMHDSTGAWSELVLARPWNVHPGRPVRVAAGVWRGLEVAIACSTGRYTPQEVRSFHSRASVAQRLLHPNVLPLFHHDVKIVLKPHPGVRGDYKLYLVKVRPAHVPPLGETGTPPCPPRCSRGARGVFPPPCDAPVRARVSAASTSCLHGRVQCKACCGSAGVL